MLVLAIDTAAHLCAAAILDDAKGEVVGQCVEDIGRGHAERMMAVIDAALGEAGIGFDAIGRIAVTVGPGSFTGIRVGVATARGLALALSVPAVGVTTLQAIAASVEGGERPVMAVLDARRGEVFGAVYGADGGEIEPPQALLPEDAARLTDRHVASLIGSGAELVAAEGAGLRVLSTPAAPAIGDVARLGAAATLGAPPAPLYLRSPDAKVQAGFTLARR
jgi:tRNA threonylcarbamoyladenosine biosynthesis protein TsaB